MKYEDVTDQYTTKKKYKIKKQKNFISEDNNVHKVNGKYVIMKPTKREIEVAELLGKTFGGQVNLIPVVLNPKGIQTPDYILDNESFDLKEIFGNGKNTLDSAISKKRRQANNFIFDISKTLMKDKQIIAQIEKIYKSKNRNWVDVIILVKCDKVLKIFKRKK